MFTGIVTHQGEFLGFQQGRKELGLTVTGPGPTLSQGDSLSVNGVCLSLIRREGDTLFFNLSQETLDKTTLSSDATRTLLEEVELQEVSLLGPAPCPLDRLRGRWRWHFLLKATRASSLGTVLRHLAERHALTGKLRLEIDRDPESLM